MVRDTTQDTDIVTRSVYVRDRMTWVIISYV